MSARLPALTARRVIRALERAGFRVARSSGSHRLLVHPGDPRRRVTVPAGRTLGRGTLRAIIRQAGLSVADFRDLLD